jgi:hypothetical protein
MQKRRPSASRTKLELLPIPRADVDRVSLVYHLALDTSRRGFGSARTVKTLTDALVISHYLREQGVGKEPDAIAVFAAAQAALNACDCAAARRGVWRVPEASAAAIGRLLCYHDRQLRIAPRHAVISAVACRDAYWIERSDTQEDAERVLKAA